MIELFDIRAFQKIAELGSISASARALAAPKSSVSRSLSRLEQTLGVALVERSTRHVRLTDAGRLYQRHATRIVNDLEEAEAALNRFTSSPRGSLRVNAPYAFILAGLVPMLPEFLKRYPELTVIFEVDNSNTYDPASDTDLLIRIGPLGNSTMVTRRLVTVELWTCASPGYLAARGTPSAVADLAHHDIIGLTERKLQWSFRANDGRVEEIELHPRAVVPDSVLTRDTLVGGGGIGVLPDFMAAEAIEKGDLVRILPQMRPESVDAHVLYPSHRSLSAKVRVFIDELVVRTTLQRAAFSGRGQTV